MFPFRSTAVLQRGWYSHYKSADVIMTDEMFRSVVLCTHVVAQVDLAYPKEQCYPPHLLPGSWGQLLLGAASSAGQLVGFQPFPRTGSWCRSWGTEHLALHTLGLIWLHALAVSHGREECLHLHPRSFGGSLSWIFILSSSYLYQTQWCGCTLPKQPLKTWYFIEVQQATSKRTWGGMLWKGTSPAASTQHFKNT